MRARTVGSDGVRRQHDARKWVAAVVAAGLMVSGCAGGGDDGDSARSEIGTTSAAPAAEAPEETPSQEPTELYGQPVTAPGVDPEGARQAAVDYMEAVGEAWRTGDVSVIRAGSEEMCGYCNTQVAEIRQMVADGQHLDGGPDISVDSAEGFAPMPDNEFHSALLEVTGSPADFLNSDGDVVARSVEENFMLLIGLRKTSNGWSVVQAIELSSEEAAVVRGERS